MGENYIVVQEDNLVHLEGKVEKFWDKGWRPVGGVLYVPISGNIMGNGYWCQAMARFETVGGVSYSVSSSTICTIPDVFPVIPPKATPPPEDKP